jgi:2-alkyl-3-oxoalkanoate reductase
MKLFISGASGFLGREVVSEALRLGHHVRAVIRKSSDTSKLPWIHHANVELSRVDLRSREGLVDALQGIDTVIHLAATKGGDIYAQAAGTVVATENLLSAMTQAHVSHLIAVSSFAVYDRVPMRRGAVLDENAPIDHRMIDRDGYAKTKLMQEELIQSHAKAQGWKLTIIRPGMIYGAHNLFNARVGVAVSDRLWVRAGASAAIPLTYVENCAEAIVLAVTAHAAGGEIINIVDDNPPTQRHYAAELRKRMTPQPRIVPLPYTVLRALAQSASLTNKLVFGNRAKIPGLLLPAQVEERAKPLRYPNDKAKRVLGWTPRYSLTEAIDRSLR